MNIKWLNNICRLLIIADLLKLPLFSDNISNKIAKYFPFFSYLKKNSILKK